MPIILDNDAADDLIGLIDLISNPKVNLLGVTIVGTGEVDGLTGAQNVADVCQFLGKPAMPIAYGNNKPCDINALPFPDDVRQSVNHFLQGKGIPKNQTPNITDSAVLLIKKLLIQSQRKVTIIATGPLTNVAEFIIQYPTLKEKIEKIVIMGGAIDVKGNVQALHPNSKEEHVELNFAADPAAVDLVFKSQVPILLVPLDLTNQVPITKEFYQALARQKQPGLILIHQLYADLLKSCRDENEFFENFCLWDPLAVRVAIEPQLVVTEKVALSVDAQTGRIDREKLQSKTGSIDAAMHLHHKEKFLMSYLETLKKQLMDHQVKISQRTVIQNQQFIDPPQASLESSLQFK